MILLTTMWVISCILVTLAILINLIALVKGTDRVYYSSLIVLQITIMLFIILTVIWTIAKTI